MSTFRTRSNYGTKNSSQFTEHSSVTETINLSGSSAESPRQNSLQRMQGEETQVKGEGEKSEK